MPSITLTDKQLRGMLRRERRVASRQQASRRQTPPAPGQRQPLRFAAPLGVDPDEDDDDGDIEHDPVHQSQAIASASDVLNDLHTFAPGCLTQSGYPYSACQGATMAAKDPAKMSATFVVVTRSKDVNRHGNMVQILPGPSGQGLQIEDWAANPVVLFDHGFGLSMPIGTAMKDGELFWNAQKSKATSTVFFSQTLPEAAAIYALIDEGILRASSIQFMPSKAMRLQGKPKEQPKDVESMDYQGYDFVESKLLEWSVVAIPADPGALKKSLDSGKVAGQRIGAGLRYALAQHLAPQKVWTPGIDFVQTQATQIVAALAKSTDAAMRAPVDTAGKTSVDAVAQKSTLAPVIDGNALADQFRQSIATPASQVDANAIADQVRQEIQRATSGVLEGFSKLSERVNQLAGN